MNEQQNDSFKQAIEDIIPKSLDDIIRHNRHLASLRLTNDEEIDDLYFPIQVGNKPTKDFIDDWSLITLNVKEQLPQVMLIGGVRGTSKNRLTSNVQQIDLKNNVLITTSRSVYELGKRNDGEPDLQQLMTICAVFHSWGFGPALGTPHFFF
jgi:hypothetical protein